MKDQQFVHPVCAGIDVHKKSVTVCLRRVRPDGTVDAQLRESRTLTRDLVALREWLLAEGCPIAVVESTGVYWRPVYNVLAPAVEVVVANPREVKQLRGKKTDKADARSLGLLLALGVIHPSFVPPPEIQAIRDLTRLRTSFVQVRTSHKNRVYKVLEHGNVKLGSVMTDVFGKSGRAMLSALATGEQRPEVLADLAKGTLRQKKADLTLAAEGMLLPHHVAMLGLSLEEIELLEAHVGRLEAMIAAQVDPLRPSLELLCTIPGVSETAARIILSEIGIDMSRFGSAGRLASWVGICPGNNESAGKRRSGRTRKGNNHLRRVLVECAWATRTTPTALGYKCRQLQSRIGYKKAVVAIGHKILVIAYHILNEGKPYDEERYGDLHQKQEERQLKSSVRTLEALGYSVNLERKAA